MEQQTPAQSTSTAKPEQTAKKSGGIFAMLGKLFLFLLIAGGLLFGGYYFGLRSSKQAQPMTPTATPGPTATATPIPPSPTPASETTKTVKAGLASSTVFKQYSIQVPAGWTDARENTETAGIDKVTISKSGYTLTIYQAALGGGGCIYKGDAASQMAQSFTDFADINGQQGMAYRRSWNQDATGKTISYTVCQKAADNSYGSITTFGRIDVVSPNPADTSVLAEIDGMIASLIKQ